MAKYSDIKGFTVQTLASDTTASQAEGGSWASANSMNTARLGGVGAGQSPAAIMAGGYVGPPGGTAATETWNGTSWTEVNDLNTAFFYSQGFGTTSAMVLAGRDAPGSPSKPTATETWNGTSWTAPGANINTNRFFGGSAGTSTAGIVFGGQSPTVRANTESWNGSAWTEVNDLNTGKGNIGNGTGTYTAAISAGGSPHTTESWDGTNWTEITDTNTQRTNSAKAGTSTDALMFGGQDPSPANSAKTESWNGTAWTELADLAAATSYNSPGGSGYASTPGGALNFGGQNPSITAVTEEWSVPATFNQITEGQLFFNSTTNTFKETISDIPAATFASGGNLNTARNAGVGAGIQTSGMLSAGRGGPPSYTNYAITEFYDGSSWTEVNDMNTGRYALGGANSGSQTATLVFGGYDTAVRTQTESWDGTNWTEVNDLNTAGSSGAGFGTQPAAIFTGGDNRSNNKTESWDGTSWTETTDLNTARAQMTGFGLATAGLIAGGDLYPVTSPTRLSVQTELWDGSSWTETGDLNTGRRRMGNGGFGTQTSGLVAGGYTTTYVNLTETWNGTSWTERTEIQTRDNTIGAGSGAVSGFIAGGGTSPGAMSTSTEEWTAPLANKTITSS